MSCFSLTQKIHRNHPVFSFSNAKRYRLKKTKKTKTKQGKQVIGLLDAEG